MILGGAERFFAMGREATRIFRIQGGSGTRFARRIEDGRANRSFRGEYRRAETRANPYK